MRTFSTLSVSPSRLSRDEEEAELTRGLDVLRSFRSEITGYRSPSWDFSPHTLGLLAGHGFGYSSNMMDDVRPYRHEGSSLVEVPIQWILDDARTSGSTGPPGRRASPPRRGRVGRHHGRDRGPGMRAIVTGAGPGRMTGLVADVTNEMACAEAVGRAARITAI